MPQGSAAGWSWEVFALVVGWGVVASAGELSGREVVCPASAIIPQALFRCWVLSWIGVCLSFRINCHTQRFLSLSWPFVVNLIDSSVELGSVGVLLDAIPDLRSFGPGPWCRVGRLLYSLLFRIPPLVSIWLCLSWSLVMVLGFWVWLACLFGFGCPTLYFAFCFFGLLALYSSAITAGFCALSLCKHLAVLDSPGGSGTSASAAPFSSLNAVACKATYLHLPPPTLINTSTAVGREVATIIDSLPGFFWGKEVAGFDEC
ncbi:hypothetical protein U1Q18_023155 [Sarracenia purpurea var. burkii]